MEAVIQKLNSKKAEVEKICNSSLPTNPIFFISHERRVENAEIFLRELKELIALLNPYMDAKITRLSTIKKELTAAEIGRMEFNGKYCKLACIQHFADTPHWLIYTAPISVL